MNMLIQYLISFISNIYIVPITNLNYMSDINPDAVAQAKQDMMDAADSYFSSRDGVRAALEKFGTDFIIINGTSVNLRDSATALGITVTDDEILAKQINALNDALHADDAALAILKMKIKAYASARNIVIL